MMPIAYLIGIIFLLGFFKDWLSDFFGIKQKEEEEQRQNEESNQVLNEIEENERRTPATYSDSQYAEMADAIQIAGFDTGTDEDSIYSTFRLLKNNTDYLKLLRAWGKPTRTVYEWGVGREMTLTQFLKWEMSTDEIAHINRILADTKYRRIKYRV